MSSNFVPQNKDRALPSSKSFAKRLVTIGGAGLLLLIGISIATSKIGARSSSQQVSTPRVLPVETVEVQKVDSYEVLRSYTGEVAEQRASQLGFERAGKLVWLGVDRGDRVIKGRAIAKLDIRNLQAQRARLLAQKAQALAVLSELKNGARTEDIAAARAEVSNLQNQLELEQIKADRRKNLYEQGAISRENFDEIAYAAKALNDRLNIARSRLEELLNGTRSEQIAAQQAAVRQLDASIEELEINIDKSTIRAPFSGIIAARQVDEGTVVQSGQSVVRLVEDTAPEVEIGVPTQIVPMLEIGSKQTVQIGDRAYQVRVASILPEIDPATRTRTVILKLQGNRRLVASGEVGRLQIAQNVKASGYWLPTTALLRGERGLWSSFTLIESEGNYRVEKRDVEVLYTDGDRVFVRGMLSDGEKVVSEGTQRLVPNQLVRPIAFQE
ncbi:MAG: efflux RND transporter periplasmic adaptor subunit [Prochloraceae cyanobacterium]|nr:efflux RND transporter periplasmic adaptor subunit [Prochloraceae cyanobacterium]